MHCLYSSCSPYIGSTKTVIMMILVVLLGIEKKIVKELGVYKNGQTVGFSFLPLKKFKAASQPAWCTKHVHGVN